MITLFFKGAPIGKARHRTTKAGRAYNAQSGVEAGIRVAAEHQYNGELLDGPLAVRFTAVYPRPKAHFGTGKNAGKLKPSAPVHHQQVEDLDNLVKFYLDCLNGIVYLDDCQVIRIYAEKQWDNNPQSTGEVSVEIYNLNGGNSE